jgi:ATP-dependent Zn protease
MREPRHIFKDRRKQAIHKAEAATILPPRDARERRSAALHEAGHAVAAVVFGLELKSVDIKRRRLPNGTLVCGSTNSEPVKPTEIAGKGEKVVKPFMIVALAGGFAQLTVDSSADVSAGAREDHEDAKGMAIAALCGTMDVDGETRVGDEELARKEDQINALIESAVAATNQFLSVYWNSVIAVTSLLMDREELSGEEVAAIVKAAT